MAVLTDTSGRLPTAVALHADRREDVFSNINNRIRDTKQPISCSRQLRTRLTSPEISVERPRTCSAQHPETMSETCYGQSLI